MSIYLTHKHFTVVPQLSSKIYGTKWSLSPTAILCYHGDPGAKFKGHIEQNAISGFQDIARGNIGQDSRKKKSCLSWMSHCKHHLMNHRFIMF